MDSEDASILETVMTVVARYGMKRTTMTELAQGAGVSRQTLYDRFGDKDGIMAAAIEHMGDRTYADLQVAFAEDTDLADKLQAYFNIAVWPTYDVLQSMPDAADLQKGMGPVSIAAGQQASERKRQALVTLLRVYLAPDSPPAEEVAAFFEQSSSQAKMSGMTRENLEQYLSVLAASVLSLAKQASHSN